MLAAPSANVAEEADPVGLVLSDFENLSSAQRDKVARSLSLLWDAFIDAFGGVSGFQAASATEQQAYLEKLEAAAHRMQAARGSEVAFHYVTVELMRQYISFVQIGSADSRAILLANTVAPLIDLGRGMNVKAVAA